MLSCTSSSSSSLHTYTSSVLEEGRDQHCDRSPPKKIPYPDLSRGNSLFVSCGDFTCHRARLWYTNRDGLLVSLSLSLSLSLFRVLSSHSRFSFYLFLSSCVSSHTDFAFSLSRADERSSYRPSGPPISCALRIDHRAARPRLSSRRVATPCVVRRTRRLAGDLIFCRFLRSETITNVDDRTKRWELVRSRSQDGRR